VRKLKRYAWLLWALVGLGMVGLGLNRGEWNVVKGWAETLCTACIGLTARY
jgi:hypothetical protein